MISLYPIGGLRMLCRNAGPYHRPFLSMLVLISLLFWDVPGMTISCYGDLKTTT